MKGKLNAFPLAGMPLETDQRGPLRFIEGRDTAPMAAMKPRTGDGPMEVTKEGRSLIMRVPIDGGGRLVVELNADEAAQLRECLVGVTE